jgi:hypothetical protein
MIKHYIISDERNKARYVCNQAVNVTLEKVANNAKEITCKNCLKYYQKHIGNVLGKDKVGVKGK